MRTKNLLMRKPESGFCGLTAMMLSFSMALAAAGGMVLAGCDSPAGVGNGNDEAVSGEASGIVLNSALDGINNDTLAKKTIKVKFDVRNGGGGLWKSEGIVSTEDDGYLVCDWDAFANDFTITITVPEDDEYLNVRWRGFDTTGAETFVRAKMKPQSGTITLDFNGRGKVATKNLYDVQVQFNQTGLAHPHRCELHADWEDAKKRAVKD